MSALAWWHWILIGLALIAAELFLPSFVVIWFGVAALVVAAATFGVELTLTGQLALWGTTSVVLLFLWFRVVKPNRFKAKVGLASADVVGEIGVMVRDVAPFEKGEVRFQKPLLGDEVWVCLSDESIKAGERVRVLAVEGNYLRVGRV